jgi:HAD superfamily hydrolase (TIGR01509 family)
VNTLTLPGRFRGVLFDMDGLLIDSEPLWVAAEVELLARHGASFGDEDREATHGRALAESVAVYAKRLGGDPVALEAELLSLIRERYEAGVPLQPGARDLVTGLVARMPIGIASSTTAPLIQLVLEGVGLWGVFQTISSGTDLGNPKPHPAAFLEGCRGLGTAPADTVAFEDSPVGVRAARAAGMFVVGVPERPGLGAVLTAAGADLVIGSLADVIIDAD